MKLRKAWAIVDAYSGQPMVWEEQLAVYPNARVARKQAEHWSGDVQVVPVEIHAVSPAARTKGKR